MPKTAFDHLSCEVGCLGAIVATDDHGMIRFCSPAGQELFGHSLSEIIGKPVTDFFPGSQQAWNSLLARPADKEEVTCFSAGVAGSARQTTPVQVTAASVRNEDGEPAGVIAVCRNAGSDSRDAERCRSSVSGANLLLESILLHSACASITLNAQGRISAWSRGAQALTGFREAEVLGRPLATLLPANNLNGQEGIRVSRRGYLDPPRRAVSLRTSNGHVLEVLFITEAA